MSGEKGGEERNKYCNFNANLNHFKRSLNQTMSPRSPLSPETPDSDSLDLAIDDAIDNPLEQLYKNICDMQSSDESHSFLSFTTYGNESRIDSELRRLVGTGIEAEPEAKEAASVMEDENLGFRKSCGDEKEKGSPKDKAASKIRGIIPSKIKSFPSSKSTNIVGQKPPIAKRNGKGLRKSVSGSWLNEERNSKDHIPVEGNIEKGVENNRDLGPYLLKKAKEILASGENPKRAFEYALRAKRSFESCEKPASLEFVMCLHILASMYCSSGKYKQAIPLLERSIQVPDLDLDLDLGQDHSLAKFVGCMRLGDIYAILGHIENSIFLYKSGLEIQKQVLGGKDPRYGETCRYIAEAHVQAFEFDEAEKLCQMALDIHMANADGSPVSVQEAADRRLMGLICESKGDYESSLEHYVIASMAMSFNGQEFDVAMLDCSIGDAYLSLSRYDEAVCSYQKALKSFKSSKGDNHPSVASVFVRLAELYNKVGKFGESKSYCENALRIYNKPSPGTNPEEVASGLVDLAAIYESMNELNLAVKLLQKALTSYNNGSGPSQQSTVAGIEAQIGVMHHMQGNYTNAYTFLKSAIAKFQAYGEKKTALYGVTLNQTGIVSVQLFKISEAADLFEEAMVVLEKEYGSYHPDTLGVCSNLAGAYDALGRLDDAIELLEYVVGTREEKLGTADPIANDEKTRLAALLKEAGRRRNSKSRSLQTLLNNRSTTSSLKWIMLE